MRLAQQLDARSAKWLPGGHLHTLWPAVQVRAQQRVGFVRPYARERWHTPDGDFIEVDWQRAATTPRGLLVLFHGLEGSSQSHYARALADVAQERGLDFVVPHFRGCGGTINLAPRAYHSGDYEEIDWVLHRLRQHTALPLMAVGVSLGGNALLRWAQEAGEHAAHTVAALASVSAPLDLHASAQAMDRGFNKQVYTRVFLRTMKPKAMQKLVQFPGLFDAQALARVSTLLAFDNLVTAPLHGFRDALDYWRRASAKPAMASIRVPALVVNALDDPFVPASSLPHAAQVAPSVTLCQPSRGGHVGFVQGSWPGQWRGIAQALTSWLTDKALVHG